MKVIKATKKFRNGEVTEFIYIPDWVTDKKENEVFEEDIVRDWADNESSGQNYGYKVSWEETTNPDEIKRCLTIEYNELKDKKRNISERIRELKRHIKKL